MEKVVVCPHCRTENEIAHERRNDSFPCRRCHAILIPSVPGEVGPADTRKGSDLDRETLIEKFSSKISRIAGVERLESFSIRRTFSYIISRHSDEEIERYFSVGSVNTTPRLSDIDTSWPKPWVFSRVFSLTLLAYFSLLMSWNYWGYYNVVPGLIIVGSIAVPFSILILFFEINVPRNISIFQILKLCLIGGIMGFVFSLIIFDITRNTFLRDWLGSSIAGLAEEPGKLLALAFVINRMRYPYILNGLLFGAAVGTGFAAIESAGYALRAGLGHFGADEEQALKDMILRRGILAPFAHIVWTAMIAGALWRVKGFRKFHIRMLRDRRFLRVFIIAVVLHMLWNAPFHLPFYGKYVAIGIVGWIVILGLVQEGLKEIRRLKAETSSSQ